MGEERGQDTQTPASAQVVFERMIQAANRHDLEAMVACFAPDFRSEQPFHPERNFTGLEGVRNNWSIFFATMPDFHVEVLDEAREEDIVWAELHYRGTQADGTEQSMRGVTLLGIQANQIAWARLYIETVQEPFSRDALSAQRA
jgi:ketosteroid isomerase-like protein